MTRPSALRAALLLAAVCLSGCSRIEQAVNSAKGGGEAAFDKAKLEAAVDRSMGGPDSCVILADTRSGAEAYRYGNHGVCNRVLPPCSTFDIPVALVGLETGAVRPGAVVKWDGSPQAAKAWEKDADVETALKLVRQYWKLAGAPEKTKFISLKHGYHGVHFGGASVNGNPAFRAAYEPLLPGCFHVETPWTYRNR